MKSNKTTVQELNPIIKKQVLGMLYQLLSDIKNSDEVQTLLTDLLPDQDLTNIAKKLAIAVYLDKGRNYSNISETLKVSSATIASVAETMGNPGIQAALRQIKADQWADEWSTKISSVVKKILPMM